MEGGNEDSPWLPALPKEKKRGKDVQGEKGTVQIPIERTTSSKGYLEKVCDLL